MTDLMRPSAFRRYPLAAGGAGDSPTPEEGRKSEGATFALAPFFGIATFALLIPVSMFVAIYFDRSFVQGDDLRYHATLYGAITLAILAGMGWGAAAVRQPRIPHFLLMIIPFVPLVTFSVTQSAPVLLVVQFVACILLLFADILVRQPDDGLSQFFRVVRVIVLVVMALGFFLLWHISGATGAVLGMQGGMVQMISHGLISGAMFLCVGVLYDRVHSRKIADYGGVANTMPAFAAFFVLFAMANAGLPGTSGFVGEFMVIIASFKANFWIAFFAATTLVLGAAYTLWMIKRVVYGEVANENVAELKDMNRREWLVLGVLAVSVLVVGLWPAPLVEMMDPTIQNLIERIALSKLG